MVLKITTSDGVETKHTPAGSEINLTEMGDKLEDIIKDALDNALFNGRFEGEDVTASGGYYDFGTITFEFI